MRVGPKGRTSGIGWGQKDGSGQKAGAKTVGPKSHGFPRNLQTKKYNGGLATSPTIQFSEDGSIFACGDCSDFVQLWDVSKILVSRDMPNPVMFKYPDEVDCISLSPDKSHIFASCPNSQQIYIYDIFRYAINLCIYFAHIGCQLIFFHNFHFFFF